MIAPAGLMLEGMVPLTAPGASNVVKVPLLSRRKPCGTKFVSPYCPVIAPAGLMPAGEAYLEPGASKVVKVPLLARRKP